MFGGGSALALADGVHIRYVVRASKRDLQSVWSGKFICKSDEIQRYTAVFRVYCTPASIPTSSPAVCRQSLSVG